MRCAVVDAGVEKLCCVALALALLQCFLLLAKKVAGGNLKRDWLVGLVGWEKVAEKAERRVWMEYGPLEAKLAGQVLSSLAGLGFPLLWTGAPPTLEDGEVTEDAVETSQLIEATGVKPHQCFDRE